MTEFFGILAAGLAIVTIILFLLYSSLRRSHSAASRLLSDLQGQVQLLQGQVQRRALEQFQQWQATELETIARQQKDIAQREAATSLQQWQFDTEGAIRADAIQRSQSVIMGKVTEHLSPFLPSFPFNPKDVRFVGSPVDLVVFDGMEQGQVQEIIFVEVKTGLAAGLTSRERQIRDAIEERRVRWQLMRIERQSRA